MFFVNFYFLDDILILNSTKQTDLANQRDKVIEPGPRLSLADLITTTGDLLETTSSRPTTNTVSKLGSL